MRFVNQAFITAIRTGIQFANVANVLVAIDYGMCSDSYQPRSEHPRLRHWRRGSNRKLGRLQTRLWSLLRTPSLALKLKRQAQQYAGIQQAFSLPPQGLVLRPCLASA